MKKLIAMLCVLCMVGLATTEVMGQNPAARQTTSSSRTQTTSSASSQAARQVKKGDVQLNKANSSYQRAQTITNTTNTRPTTVPANSSSRTTTSTARPASSSTARPASSTTARPATSTSTAKPATNASARQVTTSTTTSTSRTTTGTPAANATSARESNSTAHTSNPRGYNEQGHPQPQPAPAPNHNNPNAPKYHPYMHPNYHNFGHYMYIPPRIRPVYYHGVPYYFYNSVFCRYINGRYIICRPPLGAVIAYSIFNTWRPIIIVYNNVSYYYDDGTFYRRHSNKVDYEVVAPPIGARVAELPSTYEEIVLDGNLYYKVDNVYYKEVIVSGYLWYEVVFVS
ncbi:MAG: hypothetical protein J6T59_03810 [Bacteroidales bacterium]|nr:hypothetical protein [Bacteroidales bacterium]